MNVREGKVGSRQPVLRLKDLDLGDVFTFANDVCKPRLVIRRGLYIRLLDQFEVESVADFSDCHVIKLKHELVYELPSE